YKTLDRLLALLGRAIILLIALLCGASRLSTSFSCTASENLPSLLTLAHRFLDELPLTAANSCISTGLALLFTSALVMLCSLSSPVPRLPRSLSPPSLLNSRLSISYDGSPLLDHPRKIPSS